MTIRKFIYLLVIVSIVVFSVSVAPVYASVSRTTRVVVIPEDQIVDRDFYIAAGEVIEINGQVLGDVVAAGGQIVVNGKVTGDVIGVGGIIRISGTVDRNVRVAGGEVVIDGKIGRNVSVASGNLILTERANIGGGVIFMGGQLSAASAIPGDAAFFAGEVEISNKIKGNAEIYTDSLRLTDNAAIMGDLIYTSDSDALISKSASISGRILRKTTPYLGITKKQLSERISKFRLQFKFISFIASFIFGAFLLKFLPNLSHQVSDTIQINPLKSLFWGIGAAVLIPFFLLLLFVSVIGIPFTIILIAFSFILLYAGKLFFSFWIGEKLVGKYTKTNKYLSLFIGLVLYYAVSLIDPVALPAALLVFLVSFGAELVVITSLYKQLVSIKVI